MLYFSSFLERFQCSFYPFVYVKPLGELDKDEWKKIKLRRENEKNNGKKRKGYPCPNIKTYNKHLNN